MPAHRINSLISRATRKALYEYLMEEGCIVVREDPQLTKHEDTEIQNLHVMMMMRSLCSKKYVTKEYNWRYLYYVLTPAGIEYLRQELRLPVGPMPATYATKTQTLSRPPRPAGDRQNAGGYNNPRRPYNTTGGAPRANYDQAAPQTAAA